MLRSCKTSIPSMYAQHNNGVSTSHFVFGGIINGWR